MEAYFDHVANNKINNIQSFFKLFLKVDAELIAPIAKQGVVKRAEFPQIYSCSFASEMRTEYI